VIVSKQNSNDLARGAVGHRDPIATIDRLNLERYPSFEETRRGKQRSGKWEGLTGGQVSTYAIGQQSRRILLGILSTFTLVGEADAKR
jgi:hypothetical protein